MTGNADKLPLKIKIKNNMNVIRIAARQLMYGDKISKVDKVRGSTLFIRTTKGFAKKGTE